MCSHIRRSIKRACLSEARGWYSTLGFLFGFCQTIGSVDISLRFDIACLFLVAIHKHGVCCMNTTVVSSGELLTEESSKNLMRFTACVERPLCVCLKMLGRCDDHDARVVDLNKCKACYLVIPVSVYPGVLNSSPEWYTAPKHTAMCSASDRVVNLSLPYNKFLKY